MTGSTMDFGMSAPVGHAWTHSPQATHVDSPIGSSKSNTTLDPMLRNAIPMTSLTCTSRHARTHRLQWMQAPRLTAMAGWERSGGMMSRAAKRELSRPCLSAQCQNFELRSGDFALGG